MIHEMYKTCWVGRKYKETENSISKGLLSTLTIIAPTKPCDQIVCYKHSAYMNTLKGVYSNEKFDLLRNWLSGTTICRIESLGALEYNEILPLLGYYVGSFTCNKPFTDSASRFESGFSYDLFVDQITETAALDSPLSDRLSVVHRELRTHKWEILAWILGPVIFQRLLFECSVFMPIDENGNMLQLCGRRLHVFSKPSSFMNRAPKVALGGGNLSQSRWISLTVRKDDILYQMRSIPLEVNCDVCKVFPDEFKMSISMAISGLQDTPQYLAHVSKLLGQVVKRLQKPKSFFNIFCPKQMSPLPDKWVSMFLRKSCSKVLPRTLLGSAHNWKVLDKNIMLFVQMGRTNQLRPLEIVKGFRTRDILWLLSEHDAKIHQRNIKLLLQLVYWIFQHFLKSVVVHFFCVVDAHVPYKKLAYYRKDAWLEMSKSERRAFEYNCEATLPKHQSTELMMRSKVFGRLLSDPATVNILPKASGLRAVMNLTGVKEELTSARLALNENLKSDPTVLACYQDFLPKLEQYRRSAQGPFYVVKCDIEKCYDTANNKKLMELLPLILRQNYVRENFLLTEMKKNASFSKVTAKQISQVFASNFDEQFPVTMKSGQVVVPCGRSETLFGMEILSNLETLLTAIPVRPLMNAKTVFKTQGIPQGSSASVELCNVLLGDLTSTKLASYSKDGCSNLLVRFVDDFLFISTKETVAQKFLNTMIRGFPEYGFFCNADKTHSNFGATAKRFIYFLGFCLKCDSLEISFKSMSMPKILMPVAPRMDVVIGKILHLVRYRCGYLRAYQHQHVLISKNNTINIAKCLGNDIGTCLKLNGVRIPEKKLVKIIIRPFLQQAVNTYTQCGGQFSKDFIAHGIRQAVAALN